MPKGLWLGNADAVLDLVYHVVFNGINWVLALCVQPLHKPLALKLSQLELKVFELLEVLLLTVLCLLVLLQD